MIRLVIVDDHEIVRAGLSEVLGKEHDFEIVGAFADAEDVLAHLEELDPDVIVVDYRLPAMNGVELCRAVAERRARAAIVMLSAYLDDDLVWAAFTAGACAYVVKDASARELTEAIRLASMGRQYLDPKIASGLVGWLSRGGGVRPARPILTPAVEAVLRLAVAGNSNTQIAQKTGKSVFTVKTQLANAYRALGVKDRAEAAAAAVRAGIL